MAEKADNILIRENTAKCSAKTLQLNGQCYQFYSSWTYLIILH